MDRRPRASALIALGQTGFFGPFDLDDDVDELDVLGVGGARRVHENLTIVRIRVPGPEIPAIITSCRWLSRSGVYSIRVFTDL